MDPAIVLVSVIVIVLISILVISMIIVLVKAYVMEAKPTDPEEPISIISLPTLPSNLNDTDSPSLTMVDDGESQTQYKVTGIDSNEIRSSRRTDLESAREVCLTGEQSSGNNNMVDEDEGKINLTNFTIVEVEEAQDSCRVEDIESSRRSSRANVPGISSGEKFMLEPTGEDKGELTNTIREFSEDAEEGDSAYNKQENERVPSFESVFIAKENTVNRKQSDSLSNIDIDENSIDNEMGAYSKEYRTKEEDDVTNTEVCMEEPNVASERDKMEAI